MDINNIVHMTKEIEGKLNTIGAEGRGLHSKLDSVKNIIPIQIQKSIRYIATIRNKAIHESSFDLENIDSKSLLDHINKVNSFLDDLISRNVVSPKQHYDTVSLENDSTDEFKKIIISNSLDVFYTQFNNDNTSGCLSNVDLNDYIKDGTLNFHSLNSYKSNVNCSSRDLRSVEIIGSGDLFIDRLDNSGLDIKVLGSGNVTIKQLKSKNLNINIMGSGDVVINCEADLAKINLKGSGNVILNGNMNILDVISSGSGDIIVQGNFSKNNISNSGSGNIILNGEIITSKIMNSNYYSEQTEYL